MKISCVLFTCAFLFCDVGRCNDDLDAFVSSLAELNTNFFGTYTQYETTVIESEGAARQPEFFPSSIKMWESEDGRFLKRYSLEEYSVRNKAHRVTDEKWAYRNDDIVFTVVTSSSPTRIKSTYNGFVADRAIIYSPIGFVRGFDPVTDVQWSDVLSDPSAEASINSESEGQTRVTARLVGQGKFDFLFDTKVASNPVLLSVSCSKSGADFGNDGRYENYQYSLNSIEFVDNGGRPVISSALWTRDYVRASNGNNKPFKLSKRATLKEIKSNPDDLTRRISLPVDISDGTKVRVHDDAGVPYEFQSGVIVRVVSNKAIITTDDARFREPKRTGLYWYIILGLALVTGSGYIVVRKST